MAKNERLPDEIEATPAKKSKDKKENFFKRVGKGLDHWFRDMRGELKKVIWTPKTQMINNCIIVIVALVVSSIVIWGFDQIAIAGVDALIKLKA